MDSIDKFLKLYSYKFPKGYPDFKDKQDVKLFENILKTDFNLVFEMASIRGKATGFDSPIGAFEKYIEQSKTHIPGETTYEIEKDFSLFTFDDNNSQNIEKTDVRVKKGEEVIVNAKDKTDLKKIGQTYYIPISYKKEDYYIPLDGIRKPTGKAVEFINPDLSDKSDPDVFHDFKGGHTQEADITKLFIDQTNSNWEFEYKGKTYKITYLGDPNWRGKGNPKNDLQVDLNASIPGLYSKLKISLKAANATYVENWMLPSRAEQIFGSEKLKQIVLSLYKGLISSPNPEIGDGLFKRGLASYQICMFIKDRPPLFKGEVNPVLTDPLTNSEAFEAYTGDKKFEGTDGDANVFYKGENPTSIQQFISGLIPFADNMSKLAPLYISLRGSNESGKRNSRVFYWDNENNYWVINPQYADAAGISGSPSNNYGIE